MTKKQLNLGQVKDILAANGEEASSEVMKAALEAKYGWRAKAGLLCSNPITNEEYEAVYKDTLPVLIEVRRQATLSFARVFEGILTDESGREYLLKKTASLSGRKGGRPSGSKEPYLVWLENAMTENAERCIGRPLTANEHLEKLLQHPSIDGEGDSGELHFRRSALEDMGHDPDVKPPVITLNAITKTLTRINREARRKQ